MPVSRRRFLEGAAVMAGMPAWQRLNFAAQTASGAGGKPFGSGYFGSWLEDEFGLPAFRYTCNQITDPKAATHVDGGILASSEHVHQVGNERITAIASNYGHVRVRQDEGSPKILNDHAPERGYFAGGFGYLTDGKRVVSTYYSGKSDSFDRIFGIGYFRRRVRQDNYSIDHVIFAPFGDDPVLISQVTIASPVQASLRWIEFWGCQLYPFSFRSFMEASDSQKKYELRRDFAARFEHRFKATGDGAGLLERKDFLGRRPDEDRRFQALLADLEKTPGTFLTSLSKDTPQSSAFEDLNPPPTFLVSLDHAPDFMSSNAKDFFGSGSVNQPSGIEKPLDGDLDRSGSDSGLLLESRFSLRPGENRTLTFLYGYIPSGFDLDGLLSKYRPNVKTALGDSCAQWKKSGLHFSTEAESWVQREVAWNNYCLRSGTSYDSFFHQHVISQGGAYQYAMGLQGPARDSLQHVLPVIFGNPDLARQVLRWALKQVRPDGSIPYATTGNGMIAPIVFENSSDMALWLIWAVSEYVLANRDVRFLDTEIVTMYGPSPNALRGEGAARDTVRSLLSRCYKRMKEGVGTGQHGLMRIGQGDWNDTMVPAQVPTTSMRDCVDKGESVLNSAMAAYVFDYYARMLAYSGSEDRVTAPIRIAAEQHRAAVRGQWTGKWFRRAWLGSDVGWLGEKCLWLEPQTWALISRIASDAQTRMLLQTIDEQLRRPSPIGAFQLTPGPDQETRGDWKIEPGTSGNGGVSPSLNQMLIWALASSDAAMAWDEWKKNSLARHAEVYPQVWYGTWSGPRALNSVNSKTPGETQDASPFDGAHFPVFNMHSHACPLYALTKLLGIEFTEPGVVLGSKIPLATFRFESPLLGFIKSANAYEGWYDPSTQNTWSVTLRLPADEAKRFSRVEINGQRIHSPRLVEAGIEMRGIGGGGTAMRWSIARG